MTNLQRNFYLVILTLLISLSFSHIHHHSKKQIDERIGKTKVMYGATIRIKAAMFNYQYIAILLFSLHSHVVQYPRGSGFQSVTGFQGDNDYNSLWTIKEAQD